MSDPIDLSDAALERLKSAAEEDVGKQPYIMLSPETALALVTEVASARAFLPRLCVRPGFCPDCGCRLDLGEHASDCALAALLARAGR